MSKTAAEVLREAAALVRKGWMQGSYQEDGCYCAVGAIIKAERPSRRVVSAGALWARGPGFDALRALSAEVGGLAMDGLADVESMIEAVGDNWNDDLDRTADEVADAMERAAAKLEAAS